MKKWLPILAACTFVFAAVVILYLPASGEPPGAANGAGTPVIAARGTAAEDSARAPRQRERPAAVRLSSMPGAEQAARDRQQGPPIRPAAVQLRGAPQPDAQDPVFRAEAEEFLELHDDPARRGVLHAEALVEARTNLNGFDRERKLDAATFDALLRLQAEHQVTMHAAWYRCTLDPQCNREQDGAVQDRYIEAVDLLIGQGGYAQSQSWMHSMPTRRNVKKLSESLPVPLTTDESNALLDALNDQRGIHIHGLSESGHRFTPFIGRRGGEVLYSVDVSSVEERMASARAYSRRIRGLAATVLNSQQLKTFNQLQDDALAELQRQLRNQPGASGG